MFKSEVLDKTYKQLLKNHSYDESVKILISSLAILGDKKITNLYKKEGHISDIVIERIDKYKYPERLASFIEINSKKSKEWSNLSFAKIAFS